MHVRKHKIHSRKQAATYPTKQGKVKKSRTFRPDFVMEKWSSEEVLTQHTMCPLNYQG